MKYNCRADVFVATPHINNKNVGGNLFPSKEIKIEIKKEENI